MAIISNLFYTSRNRSLSAYMEEQDGKFLTGTIMARSEEKTLIAGELLLLIEVAAS